MCSFESSAAHKSHCGGEQQTCGGGGGREGGEVRVVQAAGLVHSDLPGEGDGASGRGGGDSSEVVEETLQLGSPHRADGGAAAWEGGRGGEGEGEGAEREK